MATGERELCEAGRADRMWGIGYNAEEAMQFTRLWGENLLGRAIMRVRGKIWERLDEHAQGVEVHWERPEMGMWEEMKREQEEKRERDCTKGRWAEN